MSSINYYEEQEITINDIYYTEDEVMEMDISVEDLREYLNGLDDAIYVFENINYYKKHYVDTFKNR